MKNSTSESVERLKIARDLHDTLAQEIAAVGFNCDEAIALSPIGPSRSSLVEMRTRLSFLSTILRDEIALLRNNQRNLAELLHDFLTEISTTTTATAGISIELNQVNVFDGSAISNARTIEIFRAVREIFTNILLHSKASTVIISASFHDGLYELSITDDGCEFDLTKNIDHSTHHFGALGASERLDSVGGMLSYSRSESANITQIQIRP